MFHIPKRGVFFLHWVSCCSTAMPVKRSPSHLECNFNEKVACHASNKEFKARVGFNIFLPHRPLWQIDWNEALYWLISKCRSGLLRSALAEHGTLQMIDAIEMWIMKLAAICEPWIMKHCLYWVAGCLPPNCIPTGWAFARESRLSDETVIAPMRLIKKKMF